MFECVNITTDYNIDITTPFLISGFYNIEAFLLFFSGLFIAHAINE